MQAGRWNDGAALEVIADAANGDTVGMGRGRLSPNGRAVVQAAKNNSSMPVVVVSGYVAEAFQAAEPLAYLYLEKPVNPEELVTIVNELLKSSERATSH